MQSKPPNGGYQARGGYYPNLRGDDSLERHEPSQGRGVSPVACMPVFARALNLNTLMLPTQSMNNAYATTADYSARCSPNEPNDSTYDTVMQNVALCAGDTSRDRVYHEKEIGSPIIQPKSKRARKR